MNDSREHKFDDYLSELFFKNYHGDKEHYEVVYSRWLEELEGTDYEMYANQYADALTQKHQEEMEEAVREERKRIGNWLLEKGHGGGNWRRLANHLITGEEL